MLDVSVRKRLAAFELNAEFHASPGITAVFGPSGAGKTMLIDLVAGLVAPDDGLISLDGRPLFAPGINVAPHRRHLGYVFQDSRLFPHMSVAANLRYGMADPGAGEFAAMVSLLGLEPMLQRRPRHLSAGERQRVAIGRALLAAPRLVLMDEPLANLDHRRRAEILPFIERLRADGDRVVLYVSHAVEEILQVADRVLVIEHGKIVDDGPVEAVLGRTTAPQTAAIAERQAVIPATVRGHHDDDGLSELTAPSGVLWVRRIDAAPGTPVRVLVQAKDVALATAEPDGVSLLNRLPGTVEQVIAVNAAQVDVRLDIGCRLWARITRRSCRQLGIAPGAPVVALIKTAAIEHAAANRSQGDPQNL